MQQAASKHQQLKQEPSCYYVAVAGSCSWYFHAEQQAGKGCQDESHPQAVAGSRQYQRCDLNAQAGHA